MRSRAWLWLAMLFAVCFTGSARAAVNGALRQLPLPAGCLTTDTAAGCGAIAAPMRNVGEPSFSKDGLHLYVPARDSNSLVVFKRDAATGALTQEACFTFADVPGCTRVNQGPMQYAIGSAVSGDGKNLYVVGAGTSPGVLEFNLDNPGAPKFETCVTKVATGDCSGAASLAAATTVAVSPDGNSVYVASLNSAPAPGDNSAITVFQRTSGGALTQAGLTGTEKCVGPIEQQASCGVVLQLRSPRDVEVTPDNGAVITTSTSCVTTGGPCDVIELARNPTSGALSTPAQACVGNGFCTPTVQTADFAQVAITKDSRTIYAVWRAAHAVLTIGRDPGTGHLTPKGCVRLAVNTECTRAASALFDPFDAALSADEDSLYTAAYNGQRIGAFDIDDTGLPAAKPGAFGCIAVAPCGSPFNQGGNVEYVIPSPDGKHVYGVGLNRVFSFIVDHPPTCTSFTQDVPFNTTVSIKLKCSDPDGDALSGYRIVNNPPRGIIPPGQSGDTLNYAPLNGASGDDSFTYTATAGGVDADPATVTLNVAAPPPSTGGVAAACLDGDHDGFCAGQDCNDANAAIRPGAPEVKGNRNDENCDGVAEPFPTLTTSIGVYWSPKGKRFRIVGLLLRNPLPKGFKAQLVCTGRRCPFKVKALKGKVKRGTLNALASLGRRRVFRAGQVLEVRVTAPKYNGKVIRYALKPGKNPIGALYCLPPGATKPQRRC